MKIIYYRKLHINKLIIIIVGLLLLASNSCQSPSKDKKGKENPQTTGSAQTNIPKVKEEIVVIDHTKPLHEPVETDQDGVYYIIEVMPEFPGGQKALMDYLKKEADTNYPQKAKQDTIQGRVILQFIVETDGSITNPVIVRAVHPMLDSVAMNIVRKMPKWIPGTHHQKPERVKYTIPVMFKFTEVSYTRAIKSIED